MYALARVRAAHAHVCARVRADVRMDGCGVWYYVAPSYGMMRHVFVCVCVCVCVCADVSACVRVIVDSAPLLRRDVYRAITSERERERGGGTEDRQTTARQFTGAWLI